MVSEKPSTRKEIKPTLALLKRFCAPLAYKLDLSSIVLFLHVIRSLDSFEVHNRDFFLKPVRRKRTRVLWFIENLNGQIQSSTYLRRASLRRLLTDCSSPIKERHLLNMQQEADERGCFSGVKFNPAPSRHCALCVCPPPPFPYAIRTVRKKIIPLVID